MLIQLFEASTKYMFIFFKTKICLGKTFGYTGDIWFNLFEDIVNIQGKYKNNWTCVHRAGAILVSPIYFTWVASWRIFLECAFCRPCKDLRKVS